MKGLVLSGGGVRGSYEVGCYYAFKKCHIKFDGYVGTSIGSFNAAMLAGKKEKELLDFWQNVDVGNILNLKPELVEAINKDDKSIDNIKTIIKNVKSIILDKGVSTSGLKKLLNDLNIEPSLRKSKKDFGLVTVKVNNLKPLCLFKEDIKEGELNDYILGSCYFPIFKQEKMIDDSYYIDGGFYDNSPTNMLIDKGYNKIYTIDMKSIGVKKRIKNNDNVIVINPSRPLGSIFELDDKVIKYNIKLGYYDTLKVIKQLDGYDYIFKHHFKWRYNMAIKRVNSDLLEDISKQFKTKDPKELIIKSLEYIMNKENYEYTNIYNVFKEIRNIKKNKKGDSKIYKFIKELR